MGTAKEALDGLAAELTRKAVAAKTNEEDAAYCDAVAMVNALRKRLADQPILSGEDLHAASEKVDEWVRLDAAHAEGNAVEALVAEYIEQAKLDGAEVPTAESLRDFAIRVREVAS